MFKLLSLGFPALFVCASVIACDPDPEAGAGATDLAEGKADDATGVVPAWIGVSGSDSPARVQIERSAAGACSNGGDYGDPVVYGSWARQRAVHRNICFEVWAPGVTDWNNPDVWKDLDVRAVYHWNDPQSLQPAAGDWEWLTHVGWVGNNAQYAFPMTWKDPFLFLSSDECPNVPFVSVNIRSEEWSFVEAELIVEFTVNGFEHLPWWDQEGFRVRYQGFVKTQCVTGAP